MKVLCIIPAYHPALEFGGIVSFTNILNQALTKQGHDVHVYTTEAGQKNLVANKQIIVQGVKINYFSYKKIFDTFTSTGWQYSPQMAKAIKENIKKFDIVHIHTIWGYPTLIASYYCQKYQKPYIIMPHASLYPFMLHKKYFKKMVYYKLFAKNILTRAAAIHYTTQDEFSKCHQALGLKNRAIVIPNGLDFKKFNNLPSKTELAKKYPILKNKKVILYLGRITWQKGLDLLIKAFAKLARKDKNIILLIVGKDEENYLKKVKQWINQTKINKQVLLTGMLTGRNKLKAYRGSDIFVLSSYSENFGMTVIEAMTCGLPVVISDQVGIHNEIKKEQAGIIVKCNQKSIYQGIKTILENPKLAHAISLKGTDMVKKYYDINKVAKKLTKEFTNVINKK